MTRAEIEAALVVAETDLDAIRDESDDLLDAQGFIARDQAMEFEGRIEAAKARAFHLRGELRKVSNKR